MSYDSHPLHPSLIRPADPLYRVDVTERTQEVLRNRERRVFPTMRTTTGRPEWRWGRRADRPSNSGPPQIFSPSDLEPGRGRDEHEHTPSIADVVKRLKP
jgi:hypothetical protein